jgi:protein SCO1/2
MTLPRANDMKNPSGRKTKTVRASVLLCCLAALPGGGAARAQSARPALLRDVGIDQKLNAQIPLDLGFRDETGRAVRLRDYFDGRPVILTLVYYECPMLCTQVLNGLVRSLQNISLEAGREFQIVTVSINPRETPQLAAAKKRIYTGIYGRPAAAGGWRFLTGEEQAIRQLARAAGFRYAYDPESGQFAHASGIMVLTPGGRLSRYLYGIQYPSRDLRLSLVEASAGRIGSPVDQILLFCYHYDPAAGKYGFAILNIVRALGLATVAAVAGLVWTLLRRERARSAPSFAAPRGHR